MKFFIYALILVYDFALIAGTAYYVDKGWSGWWFLMTVAFFVTPRRKDKENGCT